jgi:hypothetical protein
MLWCCSSRTQVFSFMLLGIKLRALYLFYQWTASQDKNNSFFFFWDRVLLCNPGWLWTLDLPASASRVLELQACTITLCPQFFKTVFCLVGLDASHLPRVLYIHFTPPTPTKIFSKTKFLDDLSLEFVRIFYQIWLQQNCWASQFYCIPL